MTDLAVQEDRGALALLTDLEEAGAIDEVSLTLTDPEMPYQRWEDLGRYLGRMGRSTSWYVGDWMNFGEALYGEESAQAVEPSTKDRYSEVERVTGLDHQTIKNLSSVCRKVARSRRRSELSWTVHREVAALDPDEQSSWLNRAVDEGLSATALREAIRGAKGTTKEPESTPQGTGVIFDGQTIGERLEEAARLVWNQAQSTSDGAYLVPAEAMAQLASALGEGGAV